MTFDNIVISGSGKVIPSEVIDQHHFTNHEFFQPTGERIDVRGDEAALKLESITGIKERRYAAENINTSDLAYEAAKQAISHAGIDPETLDQIIVGQNFGDVRTGSIQTDMVPSIASRVKHLLKIKNPSCTAFDVIFGCPGWIQGVLQAYAQIQAGMINNALIIGADTLSRVVDHADRDSMIYADGAGAIVLEKKTETEKRGILSWGSKTFTLDEAYFLFYGEGYHPEKPNKDLFIKMHGRKIYEFAITQVPQAMKEVIDESGHSITDLKKILIHQANEKMDEAIVKRFYRLYKTPQPEGVLPMSIQQLGNSSVATVPTLFDMIEKNELDGHEFNKGDLLLFASVGAGMNINAFTYLY